MWKYYRQTPWGRQLFAAIFRLGAEVKTPVVTRPLIAKSRFPFLVIGTHLIDGLDHQLPQCLSAKGSIAPVRHLEP